MVILSLVETSLETKCILKHRSPSWDGCFIFLYENMKQKTKSETSTRTNITLSPVVLFMLGVTLFGTISLVYTGYTARLKTAPSEFRISCEASGIDYVKLENASCWHQNISDEYCPLPQKLSCSIEGEFPYALLSKLET